MFSKAKMTITSKYPRNEHASGFISFVLICYLPFIIERKQPLNLWQLLLSRLLNLLVQTTYQVQRASCKKNILHIDTVYLKRTVNQFRPTPYQKLVLQVSWIVAVSWIVSLVCSGEENVKQKNCHKTSFRFQERECPSDLRLSQSLPHRAGQTSNSFSSARFKLWNFFFGDTTPKLLLPHSSFPALFSRDDSPHTQCARETGADEATKTSTGISVKSSVCRTHSRIRARLGTKRGGRFEATTTRHWQQGRGIYRNNRRSMLCCSRGILGRLAFG